MIKLSTGIEISEDTIISALKKAGISVEPKHVFSRGDIAYAHNGVKYGKNKSDWRFIVQLDGKLHGFDRWGNYSGSCGQVQFESNNYEYAGKQVDLLS